MSAFLSILLANVLSLCLLVVFIVSRWSRSRSLLEPGIVFAANLIVLYPVRGLVLLAFGDAALPDFPGSSAAENIEDASWLALLGCAGFCLGYKMLVGRRRLLILDGARRADRLDDVLVVLAFFVAALLGIGYKIATADYISFLISESRVSGLTQIGNLLASLQWPALIGAWVLWFRGHRYPWFLALFALVNVIVIPFQFIQGSKTFLSLIMVSIGIAYYWTRRELPKVLMLISLALIVTFVFPYVKHFREDLVRTHGGIPSITRLDANIVRSGPTGESLEDETLVDRLMQVSARYGGIDHLYGITQTVPDFLPFRYGTEYGAVVINLVPRLLWPDKPVFSRGADYGSALDTATSVTPFPIAEAYWDMGVPGAFLMMLLWGACLAAIVRGYAHFYMKPAASFFVALYFLSRIYWMAGGEASMPSVVAGLPQEMALLWVLYVGLRLIKGRMGRDYSQTLPRRA